jgi:hypothetical protein
MMKFGDPFLCGRTFASGVVGSAGAAAMALKSLDMSGFLG